MYLDRVNASFLKIVDVIDSVTDANQFEACNNLIDNYYVMYTQNDKRNIILIHGYVKLLKSFLQKKEQFVPIAS